MILGGYARNLNRRALRCAVARLALRPDIWSPHVRHDPEERTWHELFRDEHVSAWVICWMPGHDTGLHDHSGSAGAVTVVSGAVLEQRLAPFEDVVGSLHSRGELFDFDGNHRRSASWACTTSSARSPEPPPLCRVGVC